MTEMPQHNPETFDLLLDRVLAAAGSHAPAEGIEHRILAGVQARAASRRTHTILAWISPYPLAWASALAAVAIIALAIGSRTSPKPLPNQAATAAPAALAHPTPASAASPLRASTLLRTKPAPLAPRTVEPQPAAANADDLALSEMRAPSQPAPDLPLTAQEKLLLQLAQASHPAAEVAAVADVTPAKTAIAPADPAELQTILASLSKTLFAGMKPE